WIDNARWQGVPFYIWGGKSLHKSAVDVNVVFKNGSRLHVGIQPDVTIALDSEKIISKKPLKDAYEQVILQGLKGNHAAFAHIEEQLAAWRLLTPVLEAGQESTLDFYEKGTRGPETSDQLLEANHEWIK